MNDLIFDAAEIKRESEQITKKNEEYTTLAISIIRSLYDMRWIIKQSNDSNIISELESYQNQYSDLLHEVHQKYNDLAAIMLNYANKTTANEQQMSDTVGTASEEIKDIVE